MAHDLLRQLARGLIPDALLRVRYERHFFESTNGLLHFGKFASFDEAQTLLRARDCDGHYVIDQRKWFEERTRTYFAHDYPVLFWLSKLIQPGDRLVDLGGSTGVTYRLFRPRLTLPDEFEWQVSDLPEVVDLARQLNGENPDAHLSFTDDWKVIDGAAIVLAAGALQFFPERLSAMLDATPHHPDHILVNRMPLAEDGPGFITLHNTGVSISPMRVESRAEFLADLASRRYELVDEWKCLESSLDVPFNHECDLRYFRGCYLRRRAESGAGMAFERTSVRSPAFQLPVRIEARSRRRLPSVVGMTSRRAAGSSGKLPFHH